MPSGGAYYQRCSRRLPVRKGQSLPKVTATETPSWLEPNEQESHEFFLVTRLC